jgi:hypothetical protein
MTQLNEETEEARLLTAEDLRNLAGPAGSAPLR